MISDIKIPDYTPISDYVNFSLKYFERKKEKKIEYDNKECYGSVMSYLANCEIRCTPRNLGGLSSEIYLSWMNLCKQNGIVHENAEFYSNGGNHFLNLPWGTYNPCSVYATLCCYRWSDSMPKLAHLVVSGMEVSDVSFFQILHYAMTKFVSNNNHSFVVVDYNQTRRSSLWLGWTIGMSLFFKHKIKPESVNKLAWLNIENVIKESGFESDQLYVKKNLDIVDKRWTPFVEKGDMEGLVKEWNK